MEQLGSHWTDFHEIWSSRIFRNSAEKVKVFLKPNKNDRHFTWRPIFIFDHIALNSCWNKKYFRQNLYRKSNHTLLAQKNFIFFENLLIYQIMCEAIAKLDRLRITIRRILIASRIPKATNTHAGYVILIAFPLQPTLHESALMLRFYVHCLSCYFLGAKRSSSLLILSHPCDVYPRN
jgi:hypothetical protein